MEDGQHLPVVAGPEHGEGDDDQQASTPGSGFIQLDSDDNGSGSAEESDSDEDGDTTICKEPAFLPDGVQPRAILLSQEHEMRDVLDPMTRKRKAPENPTASHHSTDPMDPQNRKKVKLNEHDTELCPVQHLPDERSGTERPGKDKSVLLPPEIWHHVFTFCPPKTLGNLLRVNKLFNLHLDPSSRVQRDSPSVLIKSAVGVLKPDAIWRASRRLFWPHMPAPLRSRAELDMWRLICSSKCQYCNRLDSRDRQSSSTPVDPYHLGPGSRGSIIVWPFATRTCGSCLVAHSVKETDLFLSSTIPAAIIPALPFVFVTQDFHVLTVNTVQKGPLPGDLQVTKIFLADDVEELKAEFFAAKEMGAGAAEEWLKGLEGRGNRQRQEASKWEQAQSSGGVSKMRSQLHPLPPKPTLTPAQVAASIRPFEQHPWPGLPPRQERAMEVAAATKATRVAEIERRAALLSPPLLSDVLRHIRSFQAASQVAMPFDDNAWELLKPLLLAQRAEAEQARNVSEGIVDENSKQQALAGRNLEVTLATTREARDAIDKNWEEVQAPLRAQIAGFADDVISQKWNNGKDITRENSSRFAVEVLVEIRKRFYEDIAREDTTAGQTGESAKVDPPEGPFTRKLTLENMKWVFDTKIKPLTERFRREIFFCSGCENNLKAFGFEGVVQHYAAKHTNALSAGNIVVHWRAEWPHQPPFSYETRMSNKSFTRQDPTPFLPNGAAGHQPSLPPPVGLGQPQHPSPYPHPQPPSSGHAYGIPGYEGQYYQQAPPQNYGPTPGPYPAAANFSAPYAGQSGYYAPNYAPIQPSPSYAPVAVDPRQGYGPPPPVTPSGPPYTSNYGAYQANSQASYSAPQFPPPAAAYPVQLEDVARASRDVWNALNAVKDLPGGMKIFAVLYHVAKRFRSRHNEPLSLAMFNDGLSNNKDMRPVRNVSSLACKACHLGLGNAPSVQEDRTSFSFPQLANHFLKKHVEPMQLHLPHLPPLDWINDMVLLPEMHLITRFFSATNREGYKYSLLLEAFPFAAEQQAPTAPTAPQQHPACPLPESVDNHTHYYGQPSASGQLPPCEAPQNGQVGPVPPVTYPPQPYPYHPYSQAPTPAQNVVAQPQVNVAPSHQPSPAVEINQDRRGQGDGRSSRGSKSSKNQRKNNKGKGKGRNGAMSEASRRSREQETRKAEEDAQRETEQIKAMWAADKVRELQSAANAQSQAVPKKSPPSQTIKMESNETHAVRTSGVPQRPTSARRPAPGPARLAAPEPSSAPLAAPAHSTAAVPLPIQDQDDEPSILDALEMHLDNGPRQSTSQAIYVGDSSRGRRDIMVEGGAYHALRSSDYPVDRRSRSPPPHSSRHLTTRHHLGHERGVVSAGPLAHGQERVYDTRVETADFDGIRSERFQMAEADPRNFRAGSILRPEGPLPETHRGRNWVREDERAYARPPRTEEVLYEDVSRREYYTHADDLRSPDTAPVQKTLYEVVQVVDERGDVYHIKRPVRREVEAYPIAHERVHQRPTPLGSYTTQAHSVYPEYIREPQPQASREYLRGPLSQSELARVESVRRDPRDGYHQGRPENVSAITRALHPPISRADPSYYEEYDPHFPAASMTGSTGR